MHVLAHSLIPKTSLAWDGLYVCVGGGGGGGGHAVIYNNCRVHLCCNYLYYIATPSLSSSPIIKDQ